MKKKISGLIRGRLADGTPNPIDLHVGKRVHLRRTILHMSQERLAEELGITFQQVQKYEKGLNRIGASRLWDLAQVLGVNIDYFYQNLDQTTMNKSPRNIKSPLHCAQDLPDVNMEDWFRKDVIELVNAYLRIKNKDLNQQIVNLVLAMSPPKKEKKPNTPEDDAYTNPPDYIKEFNSKIHH